MRCPLAWGWVEEFIHDSRVSLAEGRLEMLVDHASWVSMPAYARLNDQLSTIVCDVEIHGVFRWRLPASDLGVVELP